MITGNGTSILGYWRYVGGIIYEAGDTILGQTSEGKCTMAAVIRQIPSTVTSFDVALTYCGPYALDPTNEYATRAYVLQQLQSLAKFFSVSGEDCVIRGDIFAVTTPGIYTISSTTSGLPPQYHYLNTFRGYLRISILNSIYYYELIDFSQKRYFLSTSDTQTWTEITSSNAINAANTVQTMINAVSNRCDDLNNALNRTDDYIHFKAYEGVITSTSLDLFREDQKAYIVNCKKSISVGSNSFVRKYSFRVDREDEAGTTYDVYGSNRRDLNFVDLATGVVVTSVYEIL